MKKILVIVVIILLVVFGPSLLSGRKENPIPKPEITADQISNRILMVKKLVTTEYHYTNMGAMENYNEVFGVKVPLTTKSFIVSYDGTIYLGIDLEKATVEIKDKEILIGLPEVQILSHEIKEDSVTIFDEETSYFNPIEISDYTNFSKEQKGVMEEKVMQSDIIETTKKNTRDAIQGFLLSGPDVEKEYKIKFVNAKKSK